MKPKVLIVDDERDVLQVLRMRFVANGYDVVSAGDGMQATAVALKEKPDLIVLDLGMPGGDGFVVAQRLRSMAATQLIPIVVLTARQGINDQQRAMDLGIERYLTKPFDASELVRVADTLTGRVAA